MNFLGEQLKNYRKEQELTQRQLAEKLFVSDKAISKWETGKGYPELDLLPRVASLLSMTVDDLLNERDPQYYYEYRSEGSIGGRPLLHTVLPVFDRRASRAGLLGSPLFRSIPAAEGVIAVGLRAKGVISVGLIAQGVIAIGLLAVGLVSAGMCGIGLLAFGNVSIGVLALGNCGVGLFAIGNVVAGILTSGNLAFGWAAIANQGYGPHSFSLGDNYTLEMYRDAVVAMHERLQQPFVDFFYRATVWTASHPIVVVPFLFALILLLFLPVITIFKKRRQLFL